MEKNQSQPKLKKKTTKKSNPLGTRPALTNLPRPTQKLGGKLTLYFGFRYGFSKPAWFWLGSRKAQNPPQPTSAHP
jgi:hypothetical protein